MSKSTLAGRALKTSSTVVVKGSTVALRRPRMGERCCTSSVKNSFPQRRLAHEFLGQSCSQGAHPELRSIGFENKVLQSVLE